MKKNMIKTIGKRLLVVGACAALTTGGALAANAVSKQITVQYNDIKLVVDNVPITPKDANGTVVEPFIYQGTTYLPVRAVGQAIGKEVTWDGESKTVYLGETPKNVNNSPDEKQTPQPTPEPTPEPEPTPQPIPEPTPKLEPTPQPTPEPTPELESTTSGRSSSTTVYVSDSSNTIHSIPNCGRLKRYRTMTLGEADAHGYKYCKKCW